MLSRHEIRRSIQGAWLLARGEVHGLDLFDLSVEGFWRSFAAAFLLAPAYVVLLVEHHARIGWPERLGGAVLADFVAYICGWIVFPCAAVFLTRLLGLTGRYVPLIVANNWASVVQTALYTPLVVLSAVLPAPLRAMLLFAATVAALIYQWFVTRTALDTTSDIAFGLVVINVLLGILVSRGIDSLLLPA